MFCAVQKMLMQHIEMKAKTAPMNFLLCNIQYSVIQKVAKENPCFSPSDVFNLLADRNGFNETGNRNYIILYFIADW